MKNFTVSITFESINSNNPLEVAKHIAKWLKADADKMIFDVIDEQTNESFNVDLSESDADAVLLNEKDICDKNGKPIKIGVSVQVDETEENHNCLGTVVSIDTKYIIVEDMDGDSFSILPSQLELE